MSYYGGTVTVKGRNMITSLLQGETIELTKVMVGSGAVPDGVEPIDMEELVNPVALAVSTVPVVDDGVMSMVVEYRNDLNGGLEEGFWLSEFGIYAKTDVQDEVLLYYATLGDSPQPVNAYKDNRIDTRRYPISISLALDAEVTVSYNPGAFITAADAQAVIKAEVQTAVQDASAVVIAEMTISSAGWVDVESDDGYTKELTMTCDIAKEAHVPIISISKESVAVASAAGLCPSAEAVDGYIKLWAQRTPETAMQMTLTLLSSLDGSGGSSGTAYVLPAATATKLGGVIIRANSGLAIEDDGSLSVDPEIYGIASSDEAAEMMDETVPAHTTSSLDDYIATSEEASEMMNETDV